MQKIESKENILGLKVFINGMPDLKMIPKEKAASMFTALELQISRDCEDSWKEDEGDS